MTRVLSSAPSTVVWGALLCSALLCSPALAQRMGGINRNAPTVQQTVTAGDTKVSLDYTSIHWGRGEWAEAAMDKENGAASRKRINDGATREPLGNFSTSVDVTCGSLKIPAGKYKIAFTISDACEWEINFIGDQTMKMKLPLMDTEMAHNRLLLCLYAEGEKSFGSYVAFGNQFATLTFAPSGGNEK